MGQPDLVGIGSTACADRHHLIRYDERGCGLSDWDVSDFSFDAWVDDLELVVDAVGVDRFPLLGLSQGGAVAIAYAVRHPERVSHLILAGAYARGRIVRADTEAERRRCGARSRRWHEWGGAATTTRSASSSPASSCPTAPASCGTHSTNCSATRPRSDNVVRFLEVFAQIDVADLAPQVRCPTLIMHSRGDIRVPQSQARELAALIPTVAW